MVKFIGKRLAYAVLTLFLITTATFFLVAGAPGDPIAAKVGQMPEQAQQIIRQKYGLDQPVVKRYTKHRSKLSFFTKEIYSYIIQFVQGV